MKRFVFWCLWRTGAAWLVRRLGRNKLTILLYHGVSPETGHVFNYRRKFINPQSFEKQVAFLSQAYTPLPLDEAVRRLRDGTLPPRALALTFDDGYRNNYEYAFPTLKKHSVPATIFLATDFVFDKKPLWVDRLEYAVEQGNETPEEKRRYDDRVRAELKSLPNEERLEKLSAIEIERNASLTEDDTRYAPLTREMLDEMRTAGISFGAHTKSHPILRHISPRETRNEILESKDIVEKECGSVSRVFAYPNGQRDDWTPGVEQILSEIGFAGALTTIPGRNSKNTPRLALRRFSMDGTDDWPTFIATESGLRGIVQALKSLWN